MFYTEQEIMEQHIALQKTYTYFKEKEIQITEFFVNNKNRKFVFLGSGSSYMLAKSAQRLFSACLDTASVAISGGDYLLNSDFYKNTIKDSIVVSLSRSGQTSEIVRDIRQIKEEFQCPVISITMKDNNDIMEYSDLDIVLDWCYDKSVCQTRTVTNLYAAVLLLASIYNQDEELAESVKIASEYNESFKNKYRPLLQNIAKKGWNNAIILADGALSGIAEEGALAFTEICMLSGKQFNLLDYRHGPMVINDEETLTIFTVRPDEKKLQGDMIQDIKCHKGTVITVTSSDDNEFDADMNVCIGNIPRIEAWGIPLIFVCQILAYEKAIVVGRNPDEPEGLDAFIILK